MATTSPLLILIYLLKYTQPLMVRLSETLTRLFEMSAASIFSPDVVIAVATAAGALLCFVAVVARRTSRRVRQVKT